ncbi:MBL fold metallo-hydrolase [Reinekea sp.]|jgi:phosphoribosyl 1,2-cyclic phosphodiesterase|uniref:MBL fold metallo-hydrolase n=1 Tax=Reinekea sp. TaxID=1970455 RepID=UPI0039899B1A
MIRVASLGSGSKGNATLIQANATTLLIDCGFGLKDVEQRLAVKGVSPGDLSAIFVTHEHGDHLKGAPMLANKYSIPLWASAGTARFFKRDVPTHQVLNPHEKYTIGDISVEPVTVPHDATEPTQFVFHASGVRVGLLTDLGSITEHVKEVYKHCNLLMLECNHDPQMLLDGPYPYSLKKRVGGDYGHLSNQQAVELLNSVDKDMLSQVLISHISEQNNDEQLAINAVEAALVNQNVSVLMLTQADGCDWLDVTKE